MDRALVKQFKVGGKFKGPDPGIIIAISEDDLEASSSIPTV